MRTRGAAIQGGLAAVGLLAAYATWQREPERAPGEVVMLDVAKADLQKVRFSDETATKWVELSQTRESGEPVIWMKLSASTMPKAPERELRGNDGALKLWEKFTPLRATRAIGKLTADKLKELGLDAPKKSIEVTERGQVRKLEVASPPFGVSDPYVKNSATGEVYVVGGGVVSDLESASVRLVDRALHGWKPQEVDGLTVSANGKKRELVQTNPELPSAKLAPKATPSKPDEMAKNWHDKVSRLMPIDLLGKGEQPPGGAPQTVFKIEYTWHGAPKGFLEIGRGAAAPAPAPAAASSQPPAPPQPPEIYARTERTASWVKIPASAEDLIKEAEKIAGAE